MHQPVFWAKVAVFAVQSACCPFIPPFPFCGGLAPLRSTDSSPTPTLPQVNRLHWFIRLELLALTSRFLCWRHNDGTQHRWRLALHRLTVCQPSPWPMSVFKPPKTSTRHCTPRATGPHADRCGNDRGANPGQTTR
jgi:hypothetical protein